MKEQLLSTTEQYGKLTNCRYEVAADAALQALLKQEHETRRRFPARSFAGCLRRLAAAKPSAIERLEAAKEAVKPPDPAKRRAAPGSEL
jgi:hypothetical protein